MRMQVFLKKLWGDIILAAWFAGMLLSFYFSRNPTGKVNYKGEIPGGTLKP